MSDPDEHLLTENPAVLLDRMIRQTALECGTALVPDHEERMAALHAYLEAPTDLDGKTITQA
jgi:hypothetical protein